MPRGYGPACSICNVSNTCNTLDTYGFCDIRRVVTAMHVAFAKLLCWQIFHILLLIHPPTAKVLEVCPTYNKQYAKQVISLSAVVNSRYLLIVQTMEMYNTAAFVHACRLVGSLRVTLEHCPNNNQYFSTDRLRHAS